MARVMVVVGAIGFVAALLLAGCASAPRPQPATVEQVEITSHPWVRPVHVVVKTPARDRYFFVGKVRATAPDDEFVAAARAVREQLIDKARALGADVVKLDVIQPDARKHQLLLSGSAYRSVE
jgi:hypothetical protein